MNRTLGIAELEQFEVLMCGRRSASTKREKVVMCYTLLMWSE